MTLNKSNILKRDKNDKIHNLTHVFSISNFYRSVFNIDVENICIVPIYLDMIQ